MRFSFLYRHPDESRDPAAPRSVSALRASPRPAQTAPKPLGEGGLRRKRVSCRADARRWIPAYAGMTTFFGVVPLLLLLSLFVSPARAEEAWLTPVIGDSWGVQVKEERTSDEELEKIKDAGLTYVRFVIPWNRVEKENGVFTWSHFEPFIKRLRKHGLKAVIILGGGHRLHTKEMKAPEGNMDHRDTYHLAPAAPAEIKAFAHYAATTVSHFDGEDIVWELWNEPDSDRFWAPEANVKDYIAVMDSACRAIRKVSPNAKIIGPGMAEMAGQRGTHRAGFLGAVLRSPLPDCLDALSMHPYRDSETPPETVLPAYDKLRAFIKAYAKKGEPRLPIVATEWGFTLTDVSEEEQAAFLLRSQLLNTLAGAPLSIWYEWRDERPGKDDPEAHFGLLTLREKEKPSYRALLEFLPPLKGAVIEERIDTGRSEDYVLKVKKADKSRAVIVWTSGASEDVFLTLEGCRLAAKTVPLTPLPTRVDCNGSAAKLTARRKVEE